MKIEDIDRLLSESEDDDIEVFEEAAGTSNETAKDPELWQPMIDYATRELNACLEILQNKGDHNDDRIAFSAAKSVAERLTQVSDSINSVLSVHEEYQKLLSFFDDR